MDLSELTSRIWSNKIDQVVTCTACKKYDDSPMVQLKCFHVYHRGCLEMLYGNISPGSAFSCKECETQCLIPANGIDGISLELLQHKQEQINRIFSNAPPPCVVCSDVTPSTHYCLECKKYMCPIDTQNHDKFIANHEVVTIDDTRKDAYLPRIISSKKAPCLNHFSDFNPKEMDSFCQQCKTLVCQLCIRTAHESHGLISIPEACRKPRELLKGKVAEVHNKYDECKYVMDTLGEILKKTDDEGKQHIQECERWGESIKDTVTRIVDARVQEIYEKTQIQKDEISKNMETLLHQKKQFQSAKEYMVTFLEFGSDLDILQKHQVFLENLTECLQQNSSVELTLDKMKVVWKHASGIQPTLEQMIAFMEDGSECHQIPAPPPTQQRLIPLPQRPSSQQQPPPIEEPPARQQPPPPPPKRYIGCQLERKWKTDEMRTGVVSDGTDIIAVKGQKINIYGFDGVNKGPIECQELRSAGDIEVNKKELFISDCHITKREILVIDRTGGVQRKIDLPANEHGLSAALSLGFDQTLGDLYIASFKTDSIYKCLNGQTKAFPFITHGLGGPMCVCVSITRELIVSNQHSHTVSKYKNDGTLVWNYGRKGTGKGELKRPIGVCVDPWGYVFVCDYDNDRIHHLSPDGEFISFIDIGRGKKIESPYAITFRNEKLIITRNTSHARQGKMCVINCIYI